MFYYDLFSHSDRFRYRAHLISSATCVLILCTALTFLPPFLLTYYTGDFWLEESIYSEQPHLDNRTKYILRAENSGTDNKFFTSSYATLNRNFQNSVLPGETIITSYDINPDGFIDQFRITFNLVFTDSTTIIKSINIWLIFQYGLRQQQRIDMETMALISFVPPSALRADSNQNITIYGQLVFEQRQAIPNSGHSVAYNKSIIDSDSLSSTPDLDSILNEYLLRDYYTSYQTHYTWMTPRTSSETNKLTVNAVVNVGRHSIRYRPGFWQAFKWGWIQYLCVLLPFIIIFNRLKLFAFSNHLVRTLVPLPKHRYKA